METKRNPRGAGRKSLPYQTNRIYVPVDLIPEIEELIKAYKAKFK